MKIAQGGAVFAEPWVSCGKKSVPFCRRPTRSIEKRLEKMHLFLSLRALRCTPACGSKEWNIYSSYPGFRDPAIANPQSPGSLHPGLSSSVPTALWSM